jgi:hypothetical protein
MATRQPVSDTPEVAEHYATQVALTAALFAALRKLWPNLSPTDLRGTFPRYLQGVTALVARFQQASISLSADHYEALRDAAGVTTRFTPPIIDPWAEEQLQAYIAKASEDLLNGLMVDEIYLAEITAEIQAEVDAASQLLVMNAGRNEIIAAIEADREAKGWARVTKPGACAFCLMLAGRGAVYKSEKTASFRAHVPKNGRGGFCQCTVQPLFGTYYEAAAHVREAKALWNSSTEGVPTEDKLNEFRRALEGRSDGKRSPRGKRGRSESPKPLVKQRLGFEFLTPDQLRHQLAILEVLPDSDYRTAQMKRVRDRLAALGA